MLSSEPDAAGYRDAAPRNGARAAVARVGRMLNVLVEGVAAILLLFEVGVLLTGVMSRYVFHRPLVWSDELASMLFIWLSMLGAAIALRRGEHMRMTGLVSLVPQGGRDFVEAVAIAASLLFLAALIGPAWEFASDEAVLVTPALEVSASWAVAALPVGMGLMIVAGIVRISRLESVGASIAGASTVLGIAALFWLGQPVFLSLGKANLIVFFVVVVGGAVLAGVPIAFAFGLATFGYLAFSTTTPVTVLVGRVNEGMAHSTLLAVPLFIFLGALIEMTGMARAMIQFLAALLGHIRGGLSYVLIAAMYLVSGISGSKIADMAATAPVLFPEMKARGTPSGDLVALLSATGAQTETIPPSIVLITIGSVTGLSIAALFTGGILPAVVLGLSLCVVVWARHRRQDLGDVKRPSRRELGRMLVVALPAILLPFVIRAAVTEGIATATEVSTIAIAYVVIVGLLIYRRFDWRKLKPILVDTSSLTGAVMIIIGCATAMAWGLTQSGFSQDLVEAMAGLPGGAVSFMAISIVAFVILGSVLEGIPAIVLFGPLLFPIARQVGIHEVHYAIVVVLAMGIGLFAPPFGVGYYGACAISKVSPDEGLAFVWRYFAALFVGLVIVAAVPWISTGFLD